METKLFRLVQQVGITPQAHVADWRVAATFYTLLCGALLFMIFELVLFHRYMEFTPAVAYINLWKTGSRAPSDPGSLPYYCSNASYNWNLSDAQIALLGPYRMINVSCGWFRDAEVYNTGDRWVGIATNILQRFEPSSASDYNATAANLSSSSSSSSFMFTTGIESYRTLFQHALDTPDGPIANPRSTLYDVHGNVFGVAGRGEPQSVFSLSLADIERLTGVTLDDVNAGMTASVPPIKFRNSGIDIAVKLHYYNTRNWVIGSDYECDITLLVQPGNWGVVGQLLNEKGVSMDRYGIRLSFEVQGQLGSFSLYQTVMHFISSFVLISVTRSVVTLLLKGMALSGYHIAVEYDDFGGTAVASTKQRARPASRPSPEAGMMVVKNRPAGDDDTTPTTGFAGSREAKTVVDELGSSPGSRNVLLFGVVPFRGEASGSAIHSGHDADGPSDVQVETY